MTSVDNWLRVITLNTWKGDGQYRERLALTAKQLQNLKADVICLQEVLKTDDGSHDTASALAASLGFSFVWLPARRKKRRINGQAHLCDSGLAILSRYKIVTHDGVQLPATDEDPERYLLGAVILTPAGPVSLVNLHLTHLEDHNDWRLHQFRSAIDYLTQAGSPPIRLCCGDFNLQLDQHTLARLQENLGHQIIDCYRLGRGIVPGNTFPANIDPVTGEVADADLCLDYILAVADENSMPPVCANAKVVMNQAGEGNILPSDHFGVMVDIFLEDI